MKKLIVIVSAVPLKRVITIKRSAIRENIKTFLYDCFNRGDFAMYHTIAQLAIDAMQDAEAMRRMFIDSCTPILLGAEMMKVIDEEIGADGHYELRVTDNKGKELARFDGTDLNY